LARRLEVVERGRGAEPRLVPVRLLITSGCVSDAVPNVTTSAVVVAKESIDAAEPVLGDTVSRVTTSAVEAEGSIELADPVLAKAPTNTRVAPAIIMIRNIGSPFKR
jgi:hypothetical protein